MRIERYSPGLAILTMVFLVILLSLGFWQLDRAKQKHALVTEYHQRFSEPARPLGEIHYDWQQHRYRKVYAFGRFETGIQVLLENQIRDGRAGVHDYRPFRTDKGTYVLVNTGWQEKNTTSVETSRENQRIEGLLRPPPEVGMRIGSLDQTPPGMPLSIPYLDIDWLSGRLALPLEPYVILSSSENTSADEWMPIRIPPEKHRGYAVTWFSLATALLILFGLYTFRKEPTDKE